MDGHNPTATSHHQSPPESYNLTEIQNTDRQPTSWSQNSGVSPTSISGTISPPQISPILHTRNVAGGQYQPLPVAVQEEYNDRQHRPQATPLQSYAPLPSGYPPYTPGDQQTKDQILYNNGPPPAQYFPQYPLYQVQDPEADNSSLLWRWFTSSWPMYAFLMLGIIGAGSHHAFYERYDGQPAHDQFKLLRYGGAIAFVTKACLVAAILFAYRQATWATVRRKHLQVATIDGMFAASEDFGAMFNLEFIRKAKVALFLVACMWVFPLTVILTQPTLGVGLQFDHTNTTCPGVRTLNFDLEGTKDWRTELKIGDEGEASLSYWNTTAMGVPADTPFNSSFFDYWDQPSAQTETIVTLSTLLGKVMPRENVSITTCGKGWNCSYTIEFTGPGYKCDEVAKGIDSNVQGLLDMGAPFDTSWLAPKGNFTYIGQTLLGDYLKPQSAIPRPGGVPGDAKTLSSKYFGAFRTEPVVWLGHADLKDDKVPKPADSTSPGWGSAWVPRISKCVHYMTRYKVLFNHTLSTQTTTILNRTYLQPLIDTTFVPGNLEDESVTDQTKATPESNFVYPQDKNRYRTVGAYHSLGRMMRTFLNGTIDTAAIALPGNMLKTQLFNSKHLAVDNFETRFRNYYEDIVLSLFYNPSFLAVAWAAKPDVRSGPLNGTDKDLAWSCTKTRLVEKFIYYKRDLWIVYAFAILVALVAVSFGAAALAENNHHARGTRFSNFVASTRAPCLDELPWKRSKWGEVPPEIYRTRMKYGVVVDASTRTPSLISPPLQVASTGDPSVYYGFAPEGRVGGHGRVEMVDGVEGLEPPKKRKTVFSFKSWQVE